MRRRGLGSGIVVVATLLFLFVPLGVVVLFSFHSSAGLDVSVRGVLDALVRRGLRRRDLRRRVRQQPRPRRSRPRWSRSSDRNAGGLRGLPHQLCGCAARCRSCSSRRCCFPGLFIGAAHAHPPGSDRVRPLAADRAHRTRRVRVPVRLHPHADRPRSARSLGRGRGARPRGRAVDGVQAGYAAADRAGARRRGGAGVHALLRRVPDHLLRHRQRPDAARLHLRSPPSHRGPRDQRRLDPAAGDHDVALGRRRRRHSARRA